MRSLRELLRSIRACPAVRRGVVLGLDFDGTLAPLVRHPSVARLPAGTRLLLSRLQRVRDVRIAIISGRDLSNVAQRVGLRGLYYSGNHGLAIRGPGLSWRHPEARKMSALVQAAARASVPVLRDFPGAWLENKGLTLTIHYRRVRPALQPGLRDALGRALKAFRRDLVLAGGKKSWEVRPRLDWDKGHALEKIARKALPGGLILFIGDDRTDEDGFRTLGDRALTVRVGPARGSAARFYLARQRRVPPFLEALLRILSARS